ncbi:hypothetical protein ACFYYV_43625, partial [Streptomyces sp. NPDC001978]
SWWLITQSGRTSEVTSRDCAPIADKSDEQRHLRERRRDAAPINHQDRAGLEAAEDSDYTAQDIDLFIRAGRQRLDDCATAWHRAVRILRDREPKFFYFSNYQNLPGRIALTDLNGQEEEPAGVPESSSRCPGEGRRALRGFGRTSGARPEQPSYV